MGESDKKENKITNIRSKATRERKPSTQTQTTRTKISEQLTLMRLVNEFDEISRELKLFNKKMDKLIEANERPLELDESIQALTKTITDLKTSISAFNNKLDILIKQINIQMSKWDLIMNEMKRMISTLSTSIEEVDDYIEDPLLEGIEDEITKKVAKFLRHYRLLGYTAFPEEVIMSKLGISAEELQRAIDELIALGWKIEREIYEE